MNQIVFATHNNHKLKEIRDIAGHNFTILGLSDIGCNEEIVENGKTIEENAIIKARFVKDNYGYNCFADDTGLEVEALNGAPGVYSARFAGEEGDSEKNIQKLLSALKHEKNRNARFRTVIALITDKGLQLFEGVVNGKIIDHKRGKSGFGYDPIFVPEGYEQTFAELGEEIKNKISHRAIATQKLLFQLPISLR